jgi:hypothetical protein
MVPISPSRSIEIVFSSGGEDAVLAAALLIAKKGSSNRHGTGRREP